MAFQPDGDVDQNGSVTAADALLAFQQALSLADLSVCQLSIADVFPQPSTPDGNITASDALCIFQKALALPSCLDTLPPSNQPPIVNAVVAQSVDAGTMVVLSGTASDPDGSIVSYAWTQTDGTTVSLAGAGNATAMFTAPDVSADETLTFRLTVTDNDGASASDEVSVTIRRVNQPPMANAGANQTVDEGQAVVLSGTASDSDGTIVSYLWEQTGGAAVALRGSDTVTAIFAAPDVSADETLTFRLTVTDDDGAQVSGDVSVTVRPVMPNKAADAHMEADNLPPVVIVEEAFPSVAEAGVIVFLTGAVDDPDGTIVSYLWEQTGGTTVSLDGLVVDDGVNEFVVDGVDEFGVEVELPSFFVFFTAPDVSVEETLTFRLTVTDDDGATGHDTVAVTVTVRPSSGTISGTVIIGEGSVVDGDTVDPFAPVVGNSSLQGQRIGLNPPITVGGHVDHQSDEVDVYHVTLAAPTDIILKIGDWPDADLDLYLADTNGAIIDGSVGYERFEAIGTGRRPEREFLVMVRASAGASNYVLSLRTFDSRRAIPEAYRSGMQLGAEFEPDGIVLEPREDLNEAQRDALLTSLVRDVSADTDGIVELERDEVIAPSGPILLEFHDALAETSSLTGQDSIPGESGIGPLHYATQGAAAKARMSRAVKTIGINPDVSYAEPNYVHHALLIPNDTEFGRQSHYSQINLPDAWDITTGRDDIVVAVIDSGVASHPDLSSRLLQGYDFISNARSSHDGDGIDPHGTHVAGTIGAETNNNLGVAGVTWQGKIMPLRVLNSEGIGSSRDIAQAILYAAGLSKASRTLPPDGPADVINMSLGPANPDCKSLGALGRAGRYAILKALDAGIHVVVAAGNDNCDVPAPMSLIPRVVNVGAVNKSGGKANFSNYGWGVDVVAPGSSVLSTWIDDSDPGASIYDYAQLSGTSMAAPHVAGVLALMLAINPNLTPEDVGPMITAPQYRIFCKLGAACPSAFQSITIDLGPTGRDRTFGFGLIDAHRAVAVAQASLGRPPNRPRLALTPDRLDFGDSRTVFTPEASNAGKRGGTIVIGQVATDMRWLSAHFVERSGTGPPFVTVRVDRTGLSPGVYFGNVFISSNGGDKTIRVTMEVEDPGGDAGTVYIIIADPDNLEPVEQVMTDADQNYEYLTPELPGGSYILIAGTDRDDDGSICDLGEACGAWRTIDSREAVNVDGDQTGVDIPVALDLITASGELPLAALLPEGMQSSDIVTNGFRISP